MNIDKETLEVISAIANILNPFALFILGGIGWAIKTKTESLQNRQQANSIRVKELEDKLRDDRIDIYNSLLEPFFILFTTDAAFSQDLKYKGKDKNKVAQSIMLSVEYRKTGFKLSLIADDPVVRAYNKLMQFFTTLTTNLKRKTKTLLLPTG
jgi:hypothetical protein